MAVGFRSSSASGATDDISTNVSIPVPAGVQTDDIVLVAIEMWASDGANDTVTPPAGFTQFINLNTVADSGDHKLKVFWKRLTGADAGNYTFTWPGSQWRLGQAVAITGAKLTGDPIGSNFNTAVQSSVSVTPSVSVSTAFEPFLAHFVTSENSTSQTQPPTGYTLTQAGNVINTNYRIPATTGTHTASGGQLAATTHQIVALIAVEPEGSSAPVTRWQRADGVALQPFLKTGSGLVELE